MLCYNASVFCLYAIRRNVKIITKPTKKKTKTTSAALKEVAKRKYEMVLIIRSEVDEEKIKNVLAGVVAIIDRHDGIINDEKHWGRKKLAYPIRHFREGYYILFHFSAKPDVIKELSASFRISEDIIRHLVININN